MTFHNLLTDEYDDFSEIEQRIVEIDRKKERGDAFEDFVYLFFDLHRDYYQIDEVYQEQDIPKQIKEDLKLESTDYGVDGIIKRRDGSIVAYQVKFKSNKEDYPSYRDLSTFWTESEYADHRYTVTNAYQITSKGGKKSNHSTILYEKFNELKPQFFEELRQKAEGNEVEHEFYEPYNYQESIIEQVVSGLEDRDRGKLIAACGTGKTLMSLWISERREDAKILFVAPSLALIRQTLDEWTDQAKSRFDYIGVCSDKTVTSDAEDRWDISLENMDAPVTTDSDEINEFLVSDNERKKVVFSTYHSLDKVAEATERGFDISIFDEAHRTAGKTQTGQFSLGLHDENIPSEKRLFMTATERMVRPGAKTRAENKGKEVFSMDDPDLYGETLARLDFGEAISEGVISDYRIALTILREEQLREYIENRKYVKTKIESDEYKTNADTLFKQLIIAKSFEDLGIQKMFSFHSRIDDSKEVAFGSGESGTSLQTVVDNTGDVGNIYASHINGSMSSGERRSIFDRFENEERALITNVNCLTEGVDVPAVDSTFFADSKKSMIDIVQASGRALRETDGSSEDLAYLIIPILMSDDQDEESIVEDSQFDQVFNIIQAMRDQDERLESWVNEINFKTGKGEKRNSGPSSEPYTVVSYQDFDFETFRSNLDIKVSESIPEPRENEFESRDFGNEDRSSDFDRKMSPIGDYSLGSLKDNLVDTTMEKFSSKDEINEYSEIKIDHNNVSHTRRLGLIRENDAGKYELTDLGKRYYSGKIEFEELFKDQLLDYEFGRDGHDIRPYLSILRVLRETDKLTQLEFVYSFYAMQDSSDSSVEQAINRVNYIREKYPRIEMLNNENQKRVLSRLNEEFKLDFDYKDVFTSRRTTYNQFLYYRSHLDCLEFIDESTDRIKVIDQDDLNKYLGKA